MKGSWGELSYAFASFIVFGLLLFVALAALDLSMVADGTYEVFWEQKLKAWDMAAGVFLDWLGVL